MHRWRIDRNECVCGDNIFFLPFFSLWAFISHMMVCCAVGGNIGKYFFRRLRRSSRKVIFLRIIHAQNLSTAWAYQFIYFGALITFQCQIRSITEILGKQQVNPQSVENKLCFPSVICINGEFGTKNTISGKRQQIGIGFCAVQKYHFGTHFAYSMPKN